MSQLSNTVAQTQLRFEQRKSLAVAFWFQEFDGYRTDPLDLSGCTLRFAAAQQPQLGSALVLEAELEILSAVGGTAQLNLQATDLDLAPGEYLYTATLITAEGFSAVFMKGELEVLENQDLLSVDDEYSGVAAPQSLSVLLGKQNRVIIGVEHLPNPELTIGTVGITDGQPTAEIVGNYPHQQLNLEFPVSPIDYDVTDAQVALLVSTPSSDTNDAIETLIDDHTWVASDISNFDEATMDLLATQLIAGANMDIVYDDTLGTLTFTASGGGGGNTLKFHPKMYGAVGDGVADDTIPLQAASTAARLFGGTVYIGGQEDTIYGITDRVDFYGDTGLEGDQFKGQLPALGSTIKFLSADAQVRLAGRESVVAESARGGSFHDFNIDANGFGHVDGAFHLDFGVSRSFYNISINNADGDGLVLDTTQNSTFTQIEITNCRGGGIVLDNGCGGNLFLKCQVSSNDVGCDCRDSLPGGHSGYPFGPGRNTFLHCLFEDYGTDGDGIALVRATHGQTTRFLSTAFSASAEAQSSGYLAHITTGGAIQTELIFGGGCTFYGHDDTNGIFVGDNARVVIEGSVGFGSMDYIFTTDGTAYGRIEGRLDFLPPVAAFNQLPGGSFENFKRLAHVGQDVIIDTEIDSALPYRMYRKGESQPRFTINDDGVLHFNDGVSGSSLGTIGWDTVGLNNLVLGGLLISGRRGSVSTTNLSASGAVVLNSKTASVWRVATAGNITSMDFSNPVNNAEFTLMIARGSMSDTIVWPTNVQWAGNRPPVVTDSNYTFIHFKYGSSDSKWKEIGRAEEVGVTTRRGQRAAFDLGSIAAWTDLSSFQALEQGFKCTLTGNITISSTTLPTPVSAGRITVRFTQDGTGSRTLTLGSSIKTAGGVDPVLSTAAGAIDVVEFVHTGTEWVARMIAQAIA